MPGTSRRILCVAPRYSHSFGTFDHAFPLLGVRAFMPPQGILTLVGYLPSEWDVRFRDENVSPVTEADLRWAEVMMVTGMHVQRAQIGALIRRARAAGALSVVGGPSVSGEPAWYPDADILHVGEIGDATDRLLARLARSVEPGSEQEVYVTENRLAIEQFPMPAYHLLDLSAYLIASLQWSSGCPYQCEFCDIPELYGRRPRAKSPGRVIAELEAMLAQGDPDTIYFVDDNFVGNPRAAAELLEELGAWQRDRGFPVTFSCECTLNAAKRPELLSLMREANFQTVFCGIETPDPLALRGMRKTQNLAVPVLEAVRTFNSHGLEVVSGIIIGLDSDTPESYDAIREFIEASQIPMLTINLLYALPRTPLWRRLEAAGRLRSDGEGHASNVRFLLPDETVLAGWRGLVRDVYEPAAVYSRFRHQMQHTYPNRPASSRSELTLQTLGRGAWVLLALLWRIGVLASYRREFWRTVALALRTGQIPGLVNAAIVSHHLIEFAHEVVSGPGEASFYSPHTASGRPADGKARSASPRTAYS